MKKSVHILLLFLLVSGVLSAQTIAKFENEPVKVEARPAEGFSYPFYLYVPAGIRDGSARKGTHTILVLPNNSGKTSDNPTFQEADVKQRLKNNVVFADRLGVVLLVPVFPRPATDWMIYTHALDRDSMLLAVQFS